DPAVAKVRWKFPELWVADPGLPSSNATLWFTPPGFHTQVTVRPTSTFRVTGLKKLLPTVTSPVGPGPMEEMSSPDEHARPASARAASHPFRFISGPCFLAGGARHRCERATGSIIDTVAGPRGLEPKTRICSRIAA